MVRQASPSLNESIKLIASNLINSMQPTDIFYGTVISVAPLQIMIDQKLILPEPFLILSNMVKDHEVDLTVSFQTENDKFLVPDHTHVFQDYLIDNKTVAPNQTQTTIDFDTTHKHEIKHKIKVMKHYALKKDEKVILLRMQGGQKYLVLDRVNTPPTEGEWL